INGDFQMATRRSRVRRPNVRGEVGPAVGSGPSAALLHTGGLAIAPGAVTRSDVGPWWWGSTHHHGDASMHGRPWGDQSGAAGPQRLTLWQPAEGPLVGARDRQQLGVVAH